MQHTVFAAAPYWKDEAIMDGHLFPVHARGMSKANLADSLVRIVGGFRRRIEELASEVDKAPQGEVTVDLIKWTVETFYDATLAGFFGTEFLRQDRVDKQELYDAFSAFDKSFPILASGMIPPALLNKIPDVKKGREGFEVLRSTCEKWSRDGFEGLDAGIVRDMAEFASAHDLGEGEAAKVSSATVDACSAFADTCLRRSWLPTCGRAWRMHPSLVSSSSCSSSKRPASSDATYSQRSTLPSKLLQRSSRPSRTSDKLSLFSHPASLRRCESAPRSLAFALSEKTFSSRRTVTTARPSSPRAHAS